MTLGLIIYMISLITSSTTDHWHLTKHSTSPGLLKHSVFQVQCMGYVWRIYEVK